MSVAESTMSEPSVIKNYDEQVFSYRPIPVLVPISLGFVFLSFSGVMLAELITVPAVGAILSFIALRQINSAPGALSGKNLALLGLFTQLAMLFGFASYHGYVYATEVPTGYERVNFTADISKKGFVREHGISGVHPDVKKLSNKKVLIKGYMFPTKQERGLKSFVLCRDSGDCCFGGQPKVTDMILVQIEGDKTVNYRKNLVAVAGEFLTESTVDESGSRPVYKLKCDYFGVAKTWY